MKRYTPKGHITELLNKIDNTHAKALLNDLLNSSAVLPINESPRFISEQEIDNVLIQLDQLIFGDEVIPDNNPELWEASGGSVLDRMNSESKTRPDGKEIEHKAEYILYHLIALHLKLQVNPPTVSDECPTCGAHARRNTTCPACGTKLRKEHPMKLPKFSFKKTALAIIVVFLLATLIPCVKVIPEGYTGIRITMGKVDPNLITPGPTFKLPFVQDIKTINNKQQTYKFSDRIWGESSEQTVVYMEGVAVSYQIMPEHSVWLYTNVTDCQTNALPPTIVASAMKSAMVELDTESVTNRSKIEPIAVQKLQEALNSKYNNTEVVHITSLNIDNMDFEENYNKAIEQRQIAKLQYEQQQIDIKKQLEKAEADKKEKEIKANAEATEKKIKAQAEAESIKTVADAQAEANKKLAGSITKDLVDYSKIEKWNGELPQVQGGNPIVDIRDDTNNE